MRLTKIIATVRGDYDKGKIVELFEAGVDVIRINFTHATPETSEALMSEINRLNAEGKTHLSLLLDTKWPDIRTGVRTTPLAISKDQIFHILIDTSKLVQDSDVFCDYPGILTDVSVGQEIIIDSGLLVVVVVEITSDYLVVKALNDAEIWSKRHINLPGAKISLPAMIEKDKTDILFGIKMGIAYVAASFIRTGENVQEIRRFLDENGGTGVKIISKIENKEALENLEAIVRYSDGIMIARWDLGIEMPIHELPVYQKKILDMCFVYGKPVIIATELMKSMVSNPFPTRAEVSDVYNSVIMRADAVMLSLSAFKPNQPVISFTTEEVLDYSFGINYWIISEKVEKFWSHMSEDQDMAIAVLKEKAFVKKGDYVLFVGERVAGNSRQPQLRIVQIDQ